MIIIRLRTGRGLNDREHHMARARRVRNERATVGWLLKGKPRPALPCVCTLTRFAPSSGLDDDGLSGALKGCRDAIAEWIGVDDRHRNIVRYEYDQRRGDWAVGIEFGSMAVSAEPPAF